MIISRSASSLLAILALALTGCTAQVGAKGSISIPKDSAQQCSTHCESIGLSLAAVAIMASHVGCVCEPPGSKAAGGESASITAGMATIAMQVQQQQQQQAAAAHH